jgi:hypothetical protein
MEYISGEVPEGSVPVITAPGRIGKDGGQRLIATMPPEEAMPMCGFRIYSIK